VISARTAAHAERLPRRATRSRRAGRKRSRSRSRIRVWIRRLLAIAVLLAVLAAAYMLWFRDSSVVAVRDVDVVGVGSSDRDEIHAALENAARGMTTLHVREDDLLAAVASYPTVRSLSVDASLPSGLTIEVSEREPVALVAVEGSDLPVAGDGTILEGVSTAELELPALDAEADAAATRVAGDALEQARVLGAAPGPLRPLIDSSTEDADGIVVELTDGIALRFGDAREAGAKWTAVSRVLADSKLGGLTYIDVRAPERPAVGGATLAPGAA
jgi:cell division protein FtsQ